MALTDNIVSYHKLDESSGDAIDELGNHDGTVTGATQGATGKINDAYSFDGNDKVLMADDAEYDFGTGAFSISAWVKTTASSNQMIVGKISGASDDYFDFRMNSNGTVRIHINDGVGDPLVNSTATINDDAFHFCVVTRSASGTLSVYIDNATPQTASGGGGDIDNAGTMEIGHWENGAFFNGTIDEVGIWKGKELTADEVDELYNSGDGLSYPFGVAAVIETIFNSSDVFTSVSYSA